MKLDRRKFLGSLVVAAGFLGAKPAIGAPWNYESIIEKIIKQELDNLKLNAKGVQEFAQHLVKHDRALQRSFLHVLGIGLVLQFENWFFIPKSKKATIHNFKKLVVERYLLSSDYFQNKMDPQKEVKFLVYFNPYTAGCFNPLIRERL